MAFDPFHPDVRGRRPVVIWLYGLTALLWLAIVLGGATRSWDAGLSIMEWAPLSGIIPPLSHAEWERLFALYRQIPQYHLINEGFGLAGFQRIFWLEWTHRFVDRLVGFALAIPMVIFWNRGMIGRRLAARLTVLFFLGAVQGAVGWFMVSSGFLPDSTAVAANRLVIHLGLGVLLYALMLWTALDVSDRLPVAAPGWRGLRGVLIAGTVLLAFTILAGGFVAGTKAGFTYNTFPLMDGHLIPADYATLHPFWRNWFENLAAVQFDHRLLATVTAVVLTLLAMTGWAKAQSRRLRVSCGLLLLAVLCQYGLGITTLLLVVPPVLGTLHQAVALLLLAAVLNLLHALRGAR